MIQNAQLIEPPPVHFAPVTPGWYVSGAVLVILLAVITVMAVRRYLYNRYRRQALQQLEMQAGSFYEVNMLLKRIAMRNYGREKVAAIQGNEWIDFLNSVWKEAAFTTEEGNAVSNELYRDPSAAAPAAFLEKCRRWIRKHRH